MRVHTALLVYIISTTLSGKPVRTESVLENEVGIRVCSFSGLCISLALSTERGLLPLSWKLTKYQLVVNNYSFADLEKSEENRKRLKWGFSNERFFKAFFLCFMSFFLEKTYAVVREWLYLLFSDKKLCFHSSFHTHHLTTQNMHSLNPWGVCAKQEPEKNSRQTLCRACVWDTHGPCHALLGSWQDASRWITKRTVHIGGPTDHFTNGFGENS